MLRNLLPDFLAVLDSEDRVAAYRRYFEAHRPLLAAYWDNYVVDPDGAHFEEVVRATVTAERDDLRAMLARTDVLALAADAHDRAAALLDTDVEAAMDRGPAGGTGREKIVAPPERVQGRAGRSVTRVSRGTFVRMTARGMEVPLGKRTKEG